MLRLHIFSYSVCSPKRPSGLIYIPILQKRSQRSELWGGNEGCSWNCTYTEMVGNQKGAKLNSHFALQLPSRKRLGYRVLMFSVPAPQCLPLALAQQLSVIGRIERDDEAETLEDLHSTFDYALASFMFPGKQCV